MKTAIAILLLLASSGLLPRDAVPVTYRTRAPYQEKLPAEGYVIPPYPTRPSQWWVPVGPLTRTQRCCDPDGDDFTIEVLSATTPATVTLTEPDAEGWRQWTLTTTVVPEHDLYIWTVKATDVRGASAVYHVVATRQNAPPVLY